MKQTMQRNTQSQSLDDKNRPAELDELNFEDDSQARRAGDQVSQADADRVQSPERAQRAGLTGATFPSGEPTDDDLAPETLIDEDGARSAQESGDSNPAEWDLTKKAEIGGGHGFDEAELARRDPLDKNPWDGDADEPLEPLQRVVHDNENDKSAR